MPELALEVDGGEAGLCGNLGLGGSWEGNRRLLTRLAELVTPGAVLSATR